MTELEIERKKRGDHVLTAIVITGFVSLILPVLTCLALYFIIGGFLSHSCEKIQISPILRVGCQVLVWIGGFILMLMFDDFLHYNYHPWNL